MSKIIFHVCKPTQDHTGMFCKTTHDKVLYTSPVYADTISRLRAFNRPRDTEGGKHPLHYVRFESVVFHATQR